MTEAELEKYYDELLDLARRVFGADKTAAEDVISDTILSALADIRAGKSIENPVAYLKTLFYRRKNDFLRRKYRDSCVIFDNGSRLSLIPERNFRENSRLDAEYSRVRQSLSRLNYIYREVMVRHYMRGESVEKVASELEIPVGTVKRRLNSGRKLVREKLDMLQIKNSELSYSPLPLTLSLWGRTGRGNEPFIRCSRRTFSSRRTKSRSTRARSPIRSESPRRMSKTSLNGSSGANSWVKHQAGSVTHGRLF